MKGSYYERTRNEELHMWEALQKAFLYKSNLDEEFMWWLFMSSTFTVNISVRFLCSLLKTMKLFEECSFFFSSCINMFTIIVSSRPWMWFSKRYSKALGLFTVCITPLDCVCSRHTICLLVVFFCFFLVCFFAVTLFLLVTLVCGDLWQKHRFIQWNGRLSL